MYSKKLVISVVALAVFMVLGVASVVTVWAWSGDAAPQIEESAEVAPVFQPQVVEPVLYTERVGHSGKGNCPYQEAKMQHVQAVPVDEVEQQQLLTQVEP